MILVNITHVGKVRVSVWGKLPLNGSINYTSKDKTERTYKSKQISSFLLKKKSTSMIQTFKMIPKIFCM